MTAGRLPRRPCAARLGTDQEQCGAGQRAHLLLHRRPYLRQSGAAGRGRRAAAERRHHERAAPGFSGAPGLDPHRADVRAARPRHHVGRDPLPALPRRLRHRHPLYRGHGMPADVRSRHDRLGDLRARAGPRQPAKRRHAPARHAGRPRGRRLRARRGASSSGSASPTSRATWRCTRCMSTVRSSASWWSTSPMAAISMRSSSRSRTTPGSTACRPATSSG